MKIELVSKGRILENYDDNILASLTNNNIEISNFCNGRGTCGKCKFKLIAGDLSEISPEELNLLSKSEIESGIRLACLSYPKSDIKIAINENKSDINVLDAGNIPDFEKNFREGYGVAIDIGTTTLTMNLVDLSTGAILDKTSSLNPQSKYGLDVMTRINFLYQNPDGISILKESITKAIENMIDELIFKNNIEKESLNEIVVAANTTMLHMLVGADAKSLGVYPYETVFLDGQNIRADDLGLSYEASVYTLPNVSAFVGSDIVAGVYLTDLKARTDSLFIDIGTNGEIVLNAGGNLYCCSTAAGPALEGMNIECGMRGESGAIESVKISSDQIEIKTIAGIEPTGICGSGLLSAVAEIVDKNLVNKRGRIIDPKDLTNEDFRKKYIREDDKGKRLILIDEKNHIYISQNDIRQVQLAKGAILSGFITLLNKEDMEISDLKSVIIAGGFGSHLKKEDIIGVGILPKEAEALIEYVGNSSLVGAYMALMNDQIKEGMKDLAKQIEYIELSTSKGYDRVFAKSMQFK